MRGTKTRCQERQVIIDWDGEGGEEIEFLDCNAFQQVKRSKKIEGGMA